jgi:DNA-binding protein H-NS
VSIQDAIVTGFQKLKWVERDFPMKLKSMTIDALVELKSRIDAVLASKVSGERRELESELARLTRYDTSAGRAKLGGRGVRGKVAPKYRNLKNPSETWAGRGLKPRWLAAAIKAGRKLDDFSIDKASKRAPRRHSGRKRAAAGPHGPGGGIND